MHYNGIGVFACNSSITDNDINHAIQVIGYNTTGNYYIIKNSWGTGWGNSGFGFVDMTNDCGIKLGVYRMLWGNSVAYLFGLVLVFLAMV